MHELSERPSFAERVTPASIARFFDVLRPDVRIVPEPPKVWKLPRDPDDEVYLDLASAVGADYLVTRDRDLLTFGEETPFATLPAGEFVARLNAE